MYYLSEYLYKTLDKMKALHPMDEFGFLDLLDSLEKNMIFHPKWTQSYFKSCLEDHKNGQNTPEQEYAMNVLMGIFIELTWAFDSWEFVDTLKQLGQAYAHLPSMNLFVESAENAMLRLQKYKREQAQAKLIERNANAIQELKELSTCSPLLIREQIELRFLQKIQAADSLESLQSIENEVSSLATDETLKIQLAKCVEEKKRFY